MGSQQCYSIILFLYFSNAKIRFCFLQCLTLLTFFPLLKFICTFLALLNCYSSTLCSFTWQHVLHVFFVYILCFIIFPCLQYVLRFDSYSHSVSSSSCTTEKQNILFLTTAKLGFLNPNWSNTKGWHLTHYMILACVSAMSMYFWEKKGNVQHIIWKSSHCIPVSAYPKHYMRPIFFILCVYFFWHLK